MPRSLGFIHNPLDRQSAERASLPLEALKADPNARTVLIAGEIPARRVRGRWYVERDDAERLLAARDAARGG